MNLTGLAFKVVPRLPPALARALFALAAYAVCLAPAKGVRQLRANLVRVVPDAPNAVMRRLVRRAMQRYLRYYCEACQLPRWSEAQVDAMIEVEGLEYAQAALAGNGKLVAALAHMGNWDLAGAWASRHLAPVVTVAERLQPDEVFQDFLALREALGMRIIPLDVGGAGAADGVPGGVRGGASGGVAGGVRGGVRGGASDGVPGGVRGGASGGVRGGVRGGASGGVPGGVRGGASGGVPSGAGAYRQLLRVARSEPRWLVPLLAERDLGHRGVEVDFFGEKALVAAGPAALALATGEPLLPVAMFRRGRRYVLRFSPEVRPDAGLAPDARLQALTQSWVKALEEQIRRHPADWHMLQKVFVADLDPAKLAAVRASKDQR
ncbi:MAG: hypothetical protein LBE08_11790 [Bifidobacteriaceae bacterium]|nr:hypothetical protein [Bifidobacteriaceae bacterium]